MTVDEGAATPGDLAVVDEILTAARSCPTVATAHDAAERPWVYDPLIGVLERHAVRATLHRLLPPVAMRPWPWWGHNGLTAYYTARLQQLLLQIGDVPRSYEDMRSEFVAMVARLRERFPADPLLPIDEAAKLAGWKCNRAGRCDAARRAAKWKRQTALPTQKINGKLCARVSDCIAWKAKAEENAKAFGRPGARPMNNRPRRNHAIPRAGSSLGSRGASEAVEDGHGHQDANT